MQFQKNVNLSANNTPYQYRTKEYFKPNSRIIYQGPKIYKEEILYQYDPNSYNINQATDEEKFLELNNEENPPSKIYAIRREIHSINKKRPQKQLIKDRSLNSSVQNFHKNLQEEIQPSPKTINIGDTKESIESNHRSFNLRRSPNIRRRIISKKNNYFNNNNQEDVIEYRNGSFDGNRNYYIIRKSKGDSPVNYLERSGNKVLDRINDGFNASGFMPPYEEQMSPYNEELNISNDFEGNISDNKKTINNYGESASFDYDYRQNRFDNMNNIQRIRNLKEYNNYSNYNNPPNDQYQSQTMNIRSKNPPNIMSSTTMTFAPNHFRPNNNYRYVPNNKDEIKEKYQNQTYNNMTYKDVKKIVNRFTKVYDPKKNNKGILIEDTQIVVPGAEDDVFNNRHRVLTKMRKLSNILLAKKNFNKNRQSSSYKNRDDEFFYAINTNNLNNKTNNNIFYNDIDNINDISQNDYNIKSYNIHPFDKKAKTPIKYINRKTKNKTNRFKYVSLAMIASKGVNTENRIILRKMRLEKGGVVDLAAQMEKKRAKYKIRKVSRSPGYDKSYYKKNMKYRETAAKKIQEWWRNLKEYMSKKIEKIVLIQSIYRGRFVRKYLYDLLYLNYLYLSFCQKIELVLKKVIKPYIFNMLKNYGKSELITSREEIKDFDKLKNIVASKEKKWKIINLRKCLNKFRNYLRQQDKITLALYKLLKIKAEKNNNKDSIMKNALRKWDYITKMEKMKLNQEKDLDEKNKIKGLFNILNGIDIYTKKSALEPTLPKVIKYLKEQKLKTILRKLINKKTISDKEKVKDYFYKYIKITLEYLNEKEKEEKRKAEEELDNLKLKTKKKPKNVIDKNESINLPQIYTREKPKRKIKLKIDKGANKMEIKGKEKTEKIKEIKEITEIREVKEIKEIKEKPQYKMGNYEKIMLKGKEKRRDDIIKMKARLFLYSISSAKNKQNKNILRKYFYKYFKKVIQIQREEDRRIFEEKEKAEREKAEKEKEEERLKSLKSIKLIPLPKIKENYNKNLLKKYFDLWKKRTFTTKESALKLFIKILDIIVDNYNKKIIRKRLNQWKKKPPIKTREKSSQTKAFPQPQTIIQQEPKEEPEIDIFKTLKNLKDIINFNDYLRNIYVNKYGKEFLDNLDKTRNPKLISKDLKKIIRKKTLVEKNNLRKAFNKWRNIVDFEKALIALKARLIYSLYGKNKNNNQSNLLQKYFDRWKNINDLENIKEEIHSLKNSHNLAKNLLIKAILRNLDNNKKNNLLKTYLNKWKSLLKDEKPIIDDLKNINKRNDLLSKLIHNRNNRDKMLLYKYLLQWRNKPNKTKTEYEYVIFRKSMINIILNKNDKHNISKAFNKWRYNKSPKIPVNAYNIAIKKLKKLFCKKPFEDFVDKMDKSNPDKLKSKGKNLKKILDKISKEKPYNKLINNMKMLIRTNKLNDVFPKVHDKLKEYYLLKYLYKWKNNVKEQKIKNIKIITKWISKKYSIEKDNKLKRRNELLKRIVNNKIKFDKYQLKTPLRLWKRIAEILSIHSNAKIIQSRNILLKAQQNKKLNQEKLKNLLLNLYKKNFIAEITDPDQYDELSKFLLTKKENKEKLRDLFNNMDDTNNKLLLRLALEKWNKDKPLYDHNLQILQNNIRQLIAKNKLNNIKLLNNLLKHIIESNEAKDKNLLHEKFLQWYLTAKKMNYHDTSKIEEFIRKIAIGRLIKKLQSTLNKYSYKYFVYLFSNIAKLNKLKNALKKKPNQMALDELKEYIRKYNINYLLENILVNQNDTYNKLLLKKYFDKWKQKVKDINDIENQKAIIIQKILRGRKKKYEINKELSIKKILIQIINRYDDNSKLHFYFARWGRIAKKISLNKNAKIIQDFCRKIHNKYLKLLKDKNFPKYQNLSKKLIKLGKNPKEDFWEKLLDLYKNKKLEQLIDDLDNKRKDILQDAFDEIKERNKMILLKKIFDNKDNRIKYLMKRILNKWKNKAFNNKYILLLLNKLIQNKENANKDILRSALNTWLYKAMLSKIKSKERIISKFCKEIQNKKNIQEKWLHLLELLKNRLKKEDINEVVDDLMTYKNLCNLFDTIDHHMKKDAMDDLKKYYNLLLFKEKLANIIENSDEKNNENKLKKYFDIWRNKADKISKRLSKLEELMDLLDLKQTRDDTNTMNQAMLLKKILHDIPNLYKYTALNKLKDFADNKELNDNLAKNLSLAKKDLKPKKISPLIDRLYKIYAYKVLDKLINNINNSMIRDSENDKNDFMRKMILLFSNKNKDYLYSNQVEQENKPLIKKLLFKTKKHDLKKNYIPEKSNAQLPLIPPLVKLLSKLINKRKQDAFDNINSNSKALNFCELLSKYVKGKINPEKEEFINNIGILKDKYENDGPQKARLFKLLRKYVIKKIFISKKPIYKMRLIFYLINLTQFNIELAKSRFIRQILRKWRFISFVRKMTREKMELMYKNLHVSYLEMVNSIFSDEESKNPGVAKEFERFGNGIGMFVNEDPYNAYDEKLCLGIKKQYLFPNNNLGLEKIGEIETKIEEKKVVLEEKLVKEKEKEKEKMEADEEEEGEEEDEKEENINNKE